MEKPKRADSFQQRPDDITLGKTTATLKDPDLVSVLGKSAKSASVDAMYNDSTATSGHSSNTSNDQYETLQKQIRNGVEASHLDTISSDLFSAISTRINQRGQMRASFDDIMSILNDKTTTIEDKSDGHSHETQSHGMIDDCVRWAILLRAIEAQDPSNPFGTENVDINKSPNGDQGAAFQICSWILNKWPYLVFSSIRTRETGRRPNQQAGNTLSKLKIHCSRQPTHFTRNVSIPFFLAARIGLPTLLVAMLKCLEKIHVGSVSEAVVSTSTLNGKLGQALSPEDVLSLVLAQDPGGSTAFTYALDTEAPIETLEALLQFTGKNTPETSSEFSHAIDNGLDKVVKVYLDNGFTMGKKIFTERLGKALDLLETDPLKPEKGGQLFMAGDVRLNIVKHLVQSANHSSKLPTSVLEVIIQQNLLDVWALKSADIPEVEVGNKLLHTAVMYERVEFVQILTERYPESLNTKCKVPPTSNHGEQLPLWYNNHKLEDNNETFTPLPSDVKTDSRTIIRDIIVTKMIHCMDMQKLTSILHNSNVDDIAFDISRFSGDMFQVSDFIDSVIFHDGWEAEKMLRFEKTLKYVEFPPLDMIPEHRETLCAGKPLAKNHDEVFRILDWLETKKGVKKIIRLVVPDRMINPHDDKTMAYYVHKFRVEALDWKVLDIAISIFQNPPLGNDDSAIENDEGYSTYLSFGDDPTVAQSHCHLTELHLYASGKRSAVCHWFNKEDGLPSIKQNFKLQITVIRETCTAQDAEELVEEITQKQNSLLDKNRVTFHNPTDLPWYPSPSPADLSKIAEHLSPKLASWLVSLTKYAAMHDASLPAGIKRRPTRVAILDNGVLRISPIASEYNRAGDTPETQSGPTSVDGSTPSEYVPPAGAPSISAPPGKTTSTEASQGLGATTPVQKMPGGFLEPPANSKARSRRGSSMHAYRPTNHAVKSQGRPNAIGNSEQGLLSRIKAGHSFVDSSSKSYPWQFPSHPHGTQMANLICSVDPLCEIYVARVAEDAFGIKPDSVTKAIKWAIDQDVDIISMSFVLSGRNDELEKAIESARNHGIIMTCSSHDEGSRTGNAYPAQYRSSDGKDCVIVLGACDQYGKLLRDPGVVKNDYRLVGENVYAGMVPFVKSVEHISGSSVATALAAGLCSLILTCDRLAHPNKEYSRGSMQLESTGVGTAIPKEESTYRRGVINKHFGEMVAAHEKGSDGGEFILLEKFGGISEPVAGQSTVPSTVSKMSKEVIPTVAHVLEERFGKEKQKGLAAKYL